MSSPGFSDQQRPNFDFAFLCDLCESFAPFAVKGFAPRNYDTATRFIPLTPISKEATISLDV
jgi:hypothetical protein